MLRKLWDAFMDRTPAEHHRVMSKRLKQAKAAEERVAEKLRELRKKKAGWRRIRRWEGRLERFGEATRIAIELVEAARPFVPGTEQTNI